MSYASAETVAAEYPQYSTQITAAAKESFLEGDDMAYIAGLIFVVLGALLIFFKYPKKDQEHELEAKFHAEDIAAMARGGAAAATAAASEPQKPGSALPDVRRAIPACKIAVSGRAADQQCKPDDWSPP